MENKLDLEWTRYVAAELQHLQGARCPWATPDGPDTEVTMSFMVGQHCHNSTTATRCSKHNA